MSLNIIENGVQGAHLTFNTSKIPATIYKNGSRFRAVTLDLAITVPTNGTAGVWFKTNPTTPPGLTNLVVSTFGTTATPAGISTVQTFWVPANWYYTVVLQSSGDATCTVNGWHEVDF